MKSFYLLPFLLFAASSCTTRLHYVGNSYQSAGNVDVFVDGSTIGKPYTIMGKGYIQQGVYSLNYITRIQPLAVAKAKQKGADAVLIQDFYVSAAETGLRTTLRTDSLGSGTVSVGNTVIDRTSGQAFTVLFLKYK